MNTSIFFYLKSTSVVIMVRDLLTIYVWWNSSTCFTWTLLLYAVDFGVSAQLDKTIGRRNTFIGTPYWYF